MQHILVIDDCIMITSSTERVLGKAGYGVTVANDSREAMMLLAQFKFDLVITDVIMPFVDGIELIEFMKDNRLNSRIIAFSSTDDEKTKLNCYRAGAEEFLSKPSSPKELTRTVHKMMNYA